MCNHACMHQPQKQSRTCIHLYAYMCTCMHAYTQHTYAQTYTQMRTYIHTYIHIYIHISTHSQDSKALVTAKWPRLSINALRQDKHTRDFTRHTSIAAPTYVVKMHSQILPPKFRKVILQFLIEKVSLLWLIGLTSLAHLKTHESSYLMSSLKCKITQNSFVYICELCWFYQWSPFLKAIQHRFGPTLPLMFGLVWIPAQKFNLLLLKNLKQHACDSCHSW